MTLHLQKFSVVNMKLNLQISKKASSRASGLAVEYVFSVLDLDVSESYPKNYICILPKNLGISQKSANVFAKIFKENGSEITTKLLGDALKDADNQKLRDEIERRLKALEPKPTAKCDACNSIFKPRNFGKHVQNLCSKCRNNGRSA